MQLYLHIANVLYLSAYLVRDILWLRVLTVIAIMCLIPYFYYRPEPMVGPIIWNGLFAAINVVQIAVLLLERRPVHLTDDEQQLYAMIFRSLTPREMAKLLKFAEWREARAGEEVCRQGEMLKDIMVVFSGYCSVHVDGREVATLRPGQFFGEMSYLTNSVTTASVVATEPLRFVAWPRDKLTAFLDRNADLRSLMQTIIGVDLVQKLQTTHEAINRSTVDR